MDQNPFAAGFQIAPSWAMFVGLCGKGLVVLGLLAFLVALVSAVAGNRRPQITRLAFLGGASCLFGAMACLAVLFVGDQFEYEYVAAHSWRDTALPYKIASIWAGQQGSFLLWACTSALFGVLCYRSAGIYQRWVLAVFSAFLGCLAAILAFESPFGILPKMVVSGQAYVPLNGVGLVPSLQNYWVVIHPPTIFLGFGSLAVMFAYAVSAMIVGDLRAWVPLVRPWALLSLSILGLGLVMGGLWAYETQGWGGFWAWDPVENVSLVPWLLVVALVHGLMVQTTRSKWFATNALLGGAPFLLFVYGTFLTRSGYLDKFSVHSFAQMDRTALWVLLAFLSVSVIGFLGLWLVRGVRVEKSTPSDSPRETALGAGAILVSLLAIAVAIGMSFPFFCGLLGKDAKVVDEPLYHEVVAWFFVPIMLLMAATPFLSWRRMTPHAFLRRFWYVLGVAVLLESAVMVMLHNSDWGRSVDATARIDLPFASSVPRIPWVMGLGFVTMLAIAGNAWRIGERIKRSKLGLGGFLAHMGVAITLAGLILSRGLEQKEQILVMEGTPGEGLGYTIRFDRMSSDPGTDQANKAVFSVASGHDQPFEARSSFFYVPGDGGAPEAFTSPAIKHTWSHDLYVSLSPPQVNLWEAPEKFMLGETKTGEGVSITYLGLAVHGKPGEAGTTFGARLKVVEDGKAYFGEPRLAVSGAADSPAISPSLRATLAGMDAADGSIQLQMPYTHMLFPIQLFYKPLTMLVWLGIGMMTFGGLMSAVYRVPRRSTSPAAERSVAREPLSRGRPRLREY